MSHINWYNQYEVIGCLEQTVIWVLTVKVGGEEGGGYVYKTLTHLLSYKPENNLIKLTIHRHKSMIKAFYKHISCHK